MKTPTAGERHCWKKVPDSEYYTGQKPWKPHGLWIRNGVSQMASFRCEKCGAVIRAEMNKKIQRKDWAEKGILECRLQVITSVHDQ